MAIVGQPLGVPGRDGRKRLAIDPGGLKIAAHASRASGRGTPFVLIRRMVGAARPPTGLSLKVGFPNPTADVYPRRPVCQGSANSGYCARGPGLWLPCL
jgi:hypothetical protein